ncbi:MAG TPA: amino acid adenylation domain-containing protein, partial [Candidatus Kapabacteria bacterium]|nr:amino acid adenylation domain-containing protein [Candidatus Kapabacteria bacterium]
EENGDKYLVAYVVSGAENVTQELRDYLAKELPDYMIPSYFIRLEKIPLLPSGKIDRRALPKPGFNKSENYTAPRDEIERKTVGLWAAVLGRDESHTSQLEASIGIDDNFFQLGGHSLKATILVSKIHKGLNVQVPLAEIFKRPTVRGLAEYIKNKVEEQYQSIEPVEKKEYYELSSAQKRLFFLRQLDPDGVAYNIPIDISLPGDFQLEKLEDVFNKLIKRHDSLRTSFHLLNNGPVQKIHDKVAFEIEYLATDKIPQHGQTRTKNFISPFDLSRAPLMRAGLLKNNDGSYILLVDMHHIITDGTSHEVLKHDFMSLYKGELLPSLRLQYKDFAQWQNSNKENERIKQQELYWLNEFPDEIPVLAISTDYPRPLMQSFAGNKINFDISAPETDLLHELALRSGATLFMVLAAILNILLARLSGQEDIVMGTPVAGRRHADLEKIIGMFVNTLALRNYPHGEMTFLEFLDFLKDRTLAAFENQEYPFDDLVEKVAINRNMGRNPLFDVLFVLQNINSISEDEVIEKRNSEDDNITQAAKFDLEINAWQAGQRLEFVFGYGTKLFKKETIERFITYFKRIVSLVVKTKKSDIRICDIEIISEEEKEKILFDFNDTAAEYPKDKTIQQLFVEQAEKTPDNISLVGANRHPRVCSVRNVCPPQDDRDVHVTYDELNKQSGRLAGMLIEKGVLPDSIVAIMMERSIEMIIGLLGILKSGGAYLPIDPNYPQERIDYMSKDSNAGILLTDDENKKTDNCQCSIVNCQLSMSETQAPHHHSALEFLRTQHSNHLAYIIYTSGTSGKAKAAAVMHSGVVNYSCWRLAAYDFRAKDVTLQLLSYTFDGFGANIYSSLFSGGKLVIVPESKKLDFSYITDLVNINGVTNTSLTPGIYAMLLDAGPGKQLESLRFVVLAGEKSDPDLIVKSREKMQQVKLYNEYGPTESTITATANLQWDISETTVVGKPIANVRIYIIDKNDLLSPIGIPGQLVIAGIGLARGYLNNPELTANRFKRNVNDQCPMTNDYFYSTGDLARWLPDGNIEFLGRIDYQVKIRGFRIELEEIEKHLLKCDSIKEAVVLARTEDSGDKYLCAYIVAIEENIVAGLREYLSNELPDYMIPSYFVPLDKIPLSPNGKIDRKALPKHGLITGESYNAPRDGVERKLIELWAGILGRDAAHVSQLQTSIGIDDNFFQLGGHSLKATILASKIHKELNVRVPLAEIFRAPVIRRLAKYIREKNKEFHIAIEPVEKREYYALSSAQKRLYFLQQLDLNSTGYNMPIVLPLGYKIEKDKLEFALKQLIVRHESLRTSFHRVNNEIVQRVHENVALTEVLGGQGILFQKGSLP